MGYSAAVLRFCGCCDWHSYSDRWWPQAHPQSWSHDPQPSSVELAQPFQIYPDSKVHGANMYPIWGWQDPGGPHVGPMNFAIWVPDPGLTYRFRLVPTLESHANYSHESTQHTLSGWWLETALQAVMNIICYMEPKYKKWKFAHHIMPFTYCEKLFDDDRLWEWPPHNSSFKWST